MRIPFVLLLVAACSSDPKSNPVEVCATGQPLVAYRTGSTGWKTLQPNAKGRYVVPVTGDYELVRVGLLADGLTLTSYFASTAAETKPIDTCPEMRDTPVHVTGHLVGSGEVWMDGYGVSSMSGAFDLQVNPGTHDLLATSGYPTPITSPRVLIQRGRMISGPADLGKIDLSTGTALTNVPVTITNATGSLFTNVFLSTTVNDLATVSTSSDATASVVPDSLLQAGDKQWVDVGENNRFAGVLYTGAGTKTSFTLPPALTGVTFSAGNTTASWASLPEPYSIAELQLFSSSSLELVAATKGWLDKHGATSLAFPTDVPGFQASWMVTSPEDATSRSGSTTGTTSPTTRSSGLRILRARGRRPHSACARCNMRCGRRRNGRIHSPVSTMKRPVRG